MAFRSPLPIPVGISVQHADVSLGRGPLPVVIGIYSGKDVGLWRGPLPFTMGKHHPRMRAITRMEYDKRVARDDKDLMDLLQILSAAGIFDA